METQSERYHLRAWVWMYNPTETQVQEQLEKATADNAPEDAVYRGADGRWFTIADIVPPELRTEVENRATQMRREKERNQ